MKTINKSKNSPEPVIGFSESLLILGIILCILGYPIIFKHQEPQAPLFISFVLLAVYGRIRGFKCVMVCEPVLTPSLSFFPSAS